MDQCARVLIIEDDADINEVTASFLRKQGYECTQAFSGSEARLLFEQRIAGEGSPFDLVITDLMLPGMTGQEIVNMIRSRTAIPIIVVSALDAPANKLELFQLGVDDYLVKPFDLDELLARIMVQLRHVQKGGSSADSSLSFKQWVLDSESRTLTAAGVHVKLTRTEFNILEALVRRPKKVFSKRELYEAAWNEDCFIEEKAINVHVSNIRSKLKDTATDEYIETVWGIGFTLTDG